MADGFGCRGSALVLPPVEAAGYAQSLEEFPLKEIGSPRWFRQHEYIEKLNMQAIINATADQDEFVKEAIYSHGKVPTLIHELLAVEVWKQKVFPILCQLQDFNPKGTFPIYIVIHHEATIINLLETILYHKDVCDSADEAVLDLADYCHRKLTLLAARNDDPENQEQNKSSPASLQELQKQNQQLEFDISLKALSILRYITDHIDSLPLSVQTRLLNTHNIPCVLVHLLEYCPWSRYSPNGELQKYTDGKWHTVPVEDRLKITKVDGQVWIALYNLILKPDCQQRYDFNNFNKNQLLKLQSFLTEVIIDQIPNLVELQRFLGHLAMTDPPPAKKDLILEQVPDIRDRIIRENSHKWKALAKHQVKTVFNPSEQDLREQAQRLTETYNLDVMENLIPDRPKCGFCGAEATKRCSRCQVERYCRRECQVKHWSKHKKACDLLAVAQNKTE
ncbi:zinc finger MYND domain-containing protein 10 isoform X1 [Hemiscyllium ocellatum]|uniref:zinc finger MYND domain-containing protein 10 isoform X1 n=1 Tax=Hemiscyllium ocellatum TaxID=170820 RepID=UPI0029670926|nr:zinc finger MYND domain-containing protein 10 isoform X1 [Hemiscyllium ocellatum]